MKKSLMKEHEKYYIWNLIISWNSWRILWWVSKMDGLNMCGIWVHMGIWVPYGLNVM